VLPSRNHAGSWLNKVSGEVASLDSYDAARFIDQLGVLLWQAYLANLLDF